MFLAPMQALAAGCVPDLTTDCDADGFTAEQGDCDDLDPDIGPGIADVCDDEMDNNCDGLLDLGCDISVRQAGIRGGGGCTGSEGVGTATPAAAFLFLPLFLLGRPSRVPNR